MKLFKSTLMLCGSLVLGSHIYAMESSNNSRNSGAAGGGRSLVSKAYAKASATEDTFLQDVDAKTAEFLHVAIRGSRGAVSGKVNPSESAYTKEEKKIDALQIDPNSVLYEIKNMKDELKSFIRSQGAEWQRPTEVEFILTALRHAKDQNMLSDANTLKSLYMLLYTYVRIPGSMVSIEVSRNRAAASAISSRDDARSEMAVKANARDYYIREAGMRRELKAQAQGLGTTLCPDRKVIGKLTKELFPYFSAAAFENGMVTDISTGDRKPLGTVELKKGQYWKVYAMEISKQSAPYNYYGHHHGYNPAQQFFTDAIQKITSPYAERFGKDTAGLLAEHNDNGHMMHGAMHHHMQQTPVPESAESKLIKKSMTADGGGAFWKRDTSYDDRYSQSGMCTYIASTFESSGMGWNQHVGRQVWQPNGDLINYTFVFERTDTPQATDSFMQRVYADRRVYLTRVYAGTRSYYMRKANEADREGNEYMRTLMTRAAQNIDSTIEQFGQEAVQGRAEKALRSAATSERWGGK
ncbi:MAG: hypothetical protein V4482_01070 [Pseudomonadota bacterium]